MSGMTYSEALLIIKKLCNPESEFDEMEEAEAIYKILTMETINAVTKDDLRRCVEWLFYRGFGDENEVCSHWVRPVPGDGEPYCSHCKNPPLCYIMSDEYEFSDYCPHCGAKMCAEEQK